MQGVLHQEIYGCTASAGEAEILREHLLQKGVRFGEEDEAEWVLIHTCIVIEHTERKMIRRIRHHLRSGRGVIVAGCLPKARGEVLEELRGDGRLYVVDTHNVPDMNRVAQGIVEIVETGWGEEMGETVKGMGLEDGVESVGGVGGVESYQGPKSASQQGAGITAVRGIIPISTGCSGGCTYCITRIARGRLKSFPEEYIISRAKRLLQQGRREIYLTSQDTAAYGMDREGSSALPELLKKLVTLPGRYFIRVGMMNPWSAKSHFDRILEAFEDEHIYRFFHLPVQSGSNSVLRRMGRPYTAEEYLRMAKKIREHFPRALLSTDVIVGFPGETEEEFEDTVKLVERATPPVLNITRFSPRPSTPAERFGGKLPGWKVKERSRYLTELHRKISRNFMEGWVGEALEVLSVEVDRRRGTTLMRSLEYLPVVVEGEYPSGEFYQVEVVDAADFYVRGRILRRAPGDGGKSSP